MMMLEWAGKKNTHFHTNLHTKTSDVHDLDTWKYRKAVPNGENTSAMDKKRNDKKKKSMKKTLAFFIGAILECIFNLDLTKNH